MANSNAIYKINEAMREKLYALAANYKQTELANQLRELKPLWFLVPEEKTEIQPLRRVGARDAKALDVVKRLTTERNEDEPYVPSFMKQDGPHAGRDLDGHLKL